MKLNDLFESVGDDTYWKEFASALSELRGAKFTLKDSKIIHDKHDNEIGREAVFSSDDLSFTITHSWKNDGSSKKPVTTIDIKDGDVIRLGRFTMWNIAKEYAEDIQRVLHKHFI